MTDVSGIVQQITELAQRDPKVREHLASAAATAEPDAAAIIRELARQMDEDPEAFEDVADRIELKPPLRIPCRTCPWRLENFGLDDPEDERARPSFYTREGRHAMWAGGLHDPGDGGVTTGRMRDGSPILCHSTYEGADDLMNAEGMSACLCVGSIAVEQRAVLRAFVRNDGDVSPLSPLGARRIVAAMLETEVDEISIEDWTVAGEPITLSMLVEACHPATFQRGIVIEEVMSPTPEELEAWGVDEG